MRRATVTRVVKDVDQASVRIGETDLGRLGSLNAALDGALWATFEHSPAFADHVERFAARARAEGAEAEALAREIEAAGIHVWHGVHDMRIDLPGTLTIAKGQARFRPTDTFTMIRTGGHG